jgi:hypothetical protein
MKWTLIRIILYISIAVTFWVGSQFYVATELFEQLHFMPHEAVFVDSRMIDDHHYFDMIRPFFTQTQFLLLQQFTDISSKSTGTFILPHKTITDALTHASQKSITTVIVLFGTYDESITLPDNMMLYGYDDTSITHDQYSNKDVITMGDSSVLYNIDVSGGRNGVQIPFGHNAQLRHLTVANGKDYNVLMGKKQRPKTPEGQSQAVTYEIRDLSDEEILQLPLLLIKDVIVTGSGNQGLYLRDGRVVITDSLVTRNGEEGIDLHPHMHTTITNTSASHNGESGLETEIYDNTLIVDNSIFDNNVKNGIAFITSLGSGTMIVKNSTISNNQKYGIRCAVHKNRPKSPRPFFQSMVTEDNNFFIDNAVRYSPECFGF